MKFSNYLPRAWWVISYWGMISYIGNSWSFSLVWVPMWWTKFPLLLNSLPQIAQGNRGWFSSCSTLKCKRRLDLVAYVLLHPANPHGIRCRGVSEWRDFIWFRKYRSDLYSLPQMWHGRWSWFPCMVERCVARQNCRIHFPQIVRSKW